MKKLLLLTKSLLAVALLCVGQNAWAAAETLGGADATTINCGIVKTSFTMLGAYNPSGKKDINDKSCLKVRWQVSNASTGNTNGFALKVNTGYKITGVTAQMSGNGGTVTLKDIKVDGTSYSGEYSKTINASTSYTNITLSDINAQEYINFEIADGSAKTQGYVYVTVTYEEVKDVIYTKSLSGWTSSDVTTTENTLNKWYNSVGIVADANATGVMIDADKGLRTCASRTTATSTLTLNHTDNSIVTIDAVWNVGSATNDANTPYVTFSYGDLTIKQNVRSNNLNTYYTINGYQVNPGSDKFARDANMTIHLKVNSYTREITEFYIKNGETIVAQYSDLTSSNNKFAEGTDYSKVTLLSCAPASSGSQRTYNYLTSLTVSEQEQAVYSYTVKGKADDSTLKTITTGENLSGTTIFYHYNQCLNVNGTLYKASTDDTGVDGSSYKSKFVLESNNQEVVKAYSQPATPITNLVFLAEGEDIFTRATGSSADTRCSMGAGGYAGSKTAFVTLPAGTYYLVLTNRCSADRTGIHKFYKGDDADPFFSADGNGYNAERASGAFTLSGTTTLYMQGGDANQYVDWLYIYGTYADGADATCLIENPDMETSAGGAEYWQEGVKGWNNCSVVTNYRQLAFTEGQNPNGAFTGTNAFENWTDIAGGLVGQMSQTISGIPNGVYKLQLAALVRTVNGQFIYGKSNGKTYKTSLSGANETANDYSVIVVVEDNQLEIGLDMNGAGADWAAIDNARLTYAPDDAVVSVTIGANKFTTFASPYPLDLTSATQTANEFTAYRAASIDGTTVTFKDDVNQKVEANTGILLKGTAGATVYIPVAATGTALADNAFHVNTSGETFAAEASYTYYGMIKDSTPLKFGTFAPGTVAIPADKAYLKVNGSGELGARQIEAIFDDTILTGISEAEAATEAIVKEGKFIVDGKLVIFKKGMKFNANGQIVK